MVSESEVAFDFLPDTQLPAVDVELIGIEGYDRHGRVGGRIVVCGHIFRTQLQAALAAVRSGSKPVNFEAQIGQYFVINDVVKKHRVRIERFLAEDDAVVECLIVANEPGPFR